MRGGWGGRAPPSKLVSFLPSHVQKLLPPLPIFSLLFLPPPLLSSSTFSHLTPPHLPLTPSHPSLWLCLSPLSWIQDCNLTLTYLKKTKSGNPVNTFLLCKSIIQCIDFFLQDSSPAELNDLKSEQLLWSLIFKFWSKVTIKVTSSKSFIPTKIPSNKICKILQPYLLRCIIKSQVLFMFSNVGQT